jgi:hypothetical protein
MVLSMIAFNVWMIYVEFATWMLELMARLSVLKRINPSIFTSSLMCMWVCHLMSLTAAFFV